jgi:1,4-alpha-glucan branching enzyme
MKQSKHHGNAENGGARLVPVRFEYFHPTARTVCVAGTFNDWDAESKPMHPLGDGHWLKETALRAGTYEYRLVVDGKWTTDPLARETVPNPFGEKNSMLRVACPPEAPQCGSPAHLPWKKADLYKETQHHVQTNTSNEQ